MRTLAKADEWRSSTAAPLPGAGSSGRSSARRTATTTATGLCGAWRGGRGGRRGQQERWDRRDRTHRALAKPGARPGGCASSEMVFLSTQSSVIGVGGVGSLAPRGPSAIRRLPPSRLGSGGAGTPTGPRWATENRPPPCGAGGGEQRRRQVLGHIGCRRGTERWGQSKLATVISGGKQTEAGSMFS